MPVKKESKTSRPSRPVTEKKNKVTPISNYTQAPAMSPESRENQLINKAVALAEKQLEDGTASAAVITHYLKLGTERERLERQILSKQSSLLEAKTSSIEHAKESENIAKEAVEAMRNYASSN